ncbi:asparaginase [Streptomyces sp. NPDC014872]|uniref:asparaginase n=1 Tax=Streptomyces sp. NPDC014872 TaxID=3364926 RepID=UPI003701A24A
MSAPDAPASRRLLVVALGGTIAMTASPASHGSDGVEPRLTARDLTAAVPELQQVGGIESIDFRQSPGASLTIDDVAELAARLRLETEHGAQGIVVTQGTDTLEETAFLLDLLYQEDTPVILTGAMRNPTLAGADGPANLLAAVRTAASPQARGRGVLVVFADEIHTARHVRKVHSTSISAFASPSAGPIGHVVEGVARFHFDAGRSAGVRSAFRRPAEVELIEVSLGSGGVLLDGLEEKVDGLVIAAFGAGHLPAAWVSRVEKIAAHIPVVLSTRTNAGSVLRSTYTFPGSERDLLSRGVIHGGSLDARKARLLLLAHLRAGSDQDAIVRAFAPYC